MLDDLAGVLIQTGAEPGKGLKFLELRVAELEIARHHPVGRPLRLAADARNGFADIDRGQHAQFEQRRREVDLPVRDGNQVGRDVGGMFCASVSMMGRAVSDPPPSSLRRWVARSSRREWI